MTLANVICEKCGMTLAVLDKAGFTARRRYPNLEHNEERMTFVAVPVETPKSRASR